jgi:hypothetical protein
LVTSTRKGGGKLMTLKKSMMIGLFCVFVAMQGTSHAWWGGCCGFLWYGSLNGAVTITGGDSNDLYVKWEILDDYPIHYGVKCLNHGGNLASDVVVYRYVSLEAGKVISGSEKNTKRGKQRDYSTTIKTAGKLASDEDCINPQWEAQDGEPGDLLGDTLLVFEAVVKISGHLIDDGGNIGEDAVFEEILHCTLPPEYDLDNYPPTGTFDKKGNVVPEESKYNCIPL